MARRRDESQNEARRMVDWHVMDSETRFMVANLVTKKREVGDAQELFKEAREAGKPELLITDGL